MSHVFILHTPFDPLNIQARAVPQPMGWRPMTPLDDYGDMQGLGSFFKKVAQTVSKVALAPIKLVSPQLAKNLSKIDNKIIDKVDDLHTKINVWAKKNSKWLIIVAAIAITIYTMGTGATIAAKMLSGMQAIGAKMAAAKAAVGSLFTSGAAAGGATAATTATTAAGTSWIATGAKLALAGSQLLVNGSKVSDLSAEQAAQMLEAQKQGYNLVDPSLQPLLQQRVQLGGGPIQYDANGYPIEPTGGFGQVPAGITANGTYAPGTYTPGIGGGGSMGSGSSNPWLVPALVVGGIGLVVLATR
ncbi:hypothetical protein [Geothrix campi]|uniref:hypothetical protein n=1 Tax=Geothrix campi TaxID=2966450 RepID=UPI002148D908|nr:hypothetical protein [Geothrix sp. SG10]